MNRRAFLIGLGLAAPAIIRPGLLMPVRLVPALTEPHVWIWKEYMIGSLQLADRNKFGIPILGRPGLSLAEAELRFAQITENMFKAGSGPLSPNGLGSLLGDAPPPLTAPAIIRNFITRHAQQWARMVPQDRRHIDNPAIARHDAGSESGGAARASADDSASDQDADFRSRFHRRRFFSIPMPRRSL